MQMWNLAQIEVKPPFDTAQVMLWCGVLILVVIVGFGLIAYLRKHFREKAKGAGPDAGFSLSDLRAMRDRGEITPEEYDQTRERVIAKVKGKTKKKKNAQVEDPEEDAPAEPDKKAVEESDAKESDDAAAEADEEADEDTQLGSDNP